MPNSAEGLSMTPGNTRMTVITPLAGGWRKM
jgi:hypothetical protein